MVRFLVFSLVMHCFTMGVYAQNWTLVSSKSIEEQGQIDIKPSIFKAYSIDNEYIKNVVFNAPNESQVSNAYESKSQIKLPTADGLIHTFSLVNYNLLHPDLQKSYPEIKALYGISIDDATMTIVADYSPTYGFRAVISQPGVGKTYIDHFQRNDLNHRVVYYRKDYQRFSNWSCGVEGSGIRNDEDLQGNRSLLIGDCLFREYRLALACTGEYAAFHGGTVAGALAAMNTTMNRVNGVFAQEIAIRCVIIANNTNIIYTNSATDPYTNTNGSTMLGQNQTTCDGVIGSANYDIGHVFSTGGGGVAYTPSVCNNSIKAGGVTGSGAPVGDPFDIDYVAHEMGHQLSANHTQNNSCQRNTATAMEPGSASSIMGYAGICSPNVQLNSDENYHATSLQEIKTFLIGNGSTCDIPVAGYNNAPPNISAPSNNTTYNIPISTPFALTMTATDPNGNGIIYGWDQMNNNTATMPPAATNTVGPTFRFLEPTSNPTRYFPNLSAILAGNLVGAPYGGSNWEVVPSVARTMNFRGVARDVTPMSASCNSEVDVIVNTISGTTAFKVTGLDVSTTWLETETRTITWNVGGSNAGTVNTPNVSILMSYDGGLTFPVTLVASTSNDGSHPITVPTGITTTARIMVRAVGNIFFDINDANIIVNSGVPSFEMVASNTSLNLCPSSQGSINLNVNSILGYTGSVTLSLSGVPSGLTTSFSTNPVTVGQSSVINFNNISTATGSYTILLTGVSGSITKNLSFNITIQSSVITTTLATPANNATNISVFPTLTWTSSVTPSVYELQISRRSDFSNIVSSITNITTTNYTVTSPLLGYSEYYWRVRSVSGCGTPQWSSIAFKFETESCMTYTNTNLPITIQDNATTTSSYTINDKGTITDLNILDLEGTHSYVGDLRFNLISPATTSVRFWNRPCNSAQNQNFNINFDQSAAAGTPPCPPTNDGTYLPNGTGVGSLNSFNTQSIKGNWRMTVQDLQATDAGILQLWRLRTCMTNFCRLTVDTDAPKGAGSLYAAINCASAGDTIRFASNIVNDSIYLENEFLTINKTIFIESSLTSNIHIFSNSTSPTIVASAPNTGFGLKIKGLHIHSSNSTGIGALQNSGLLNLEDVYLYKSVGSSTTIQNNNGSINNITGDCRINP